MKVKKAHVLIGIPEKQERDELIALIRSREPFDIVPASDFASLESAAARMVPQVIVATESIIPPSLSFEESTRRLTPFAPVVMVASSERQSELVGMVISGEVDFVTFSEKFALVAAAFVELRLNSPHSYSREFRSAWTADVPSDFAEILRHEINNPLTGILGNAELLLAHLRGKLPPLSLQRLETVVDLAVRLRETVRCLTADSERHESSVHSA